MIKILDDETEKHIQNDINWDAHNNEIIKAANKSESAKGDVEQFAADSFFHGWQKAREYFENPDSSKASNSTRLK